MLDDVPLQVVLAASLPPVLMLACTHEPQILNAGPLITAQAIKHSGGSPGADALWAIWHGLELMLRRGLFVKLGAVAMLHGITSSGLWEVLQQYLQLRLGFTTLDQVTM